MRASRSLAGQWLFQLDPGGQLDVAQLHPDRAITVPLPWQAAFPDLVRYSGYAWYQRAFDLEKGELEGELLLHFGAVDYWCQVYVNGQCVGEHEGGYTPFDFAIRQYVKVGQNTLAVRVYDSAMDSIRVRRWFDDPADDTTQPPFDPRLVPHGKQEWYYNIGGIWQDVTLTAVPAAYIRGVHITPDIHSGVARVDVNIAGGIPNAPLRVEIGGVSVTAGVTDGKTRYSLSAQVDDPQWWTPETPHLYTARVTLGDGDREDMLEARFGFREIRTQDGQLLLNGQPIILLSALDQDFYPTTIYTVPSDDFLRDQFCKARELGLNSLRCHIKVPDPRYLDLADEIGLLIWEEIPSWRTFYPRSTAYPAGVYLPDAVKDRARQTLEEMIVRDYNHPSLIAYSIVNEDWGTSLLLSQADREWVVEMVDFAKLLDSTRLVVDNSPCPAPWGLSVHVKTDLDDFHIYTNIPEQAETFEQFVEQLALRPTWSFTADGLSQRTGHEPLILSEFGNWGLPALRAIAADGEPDWFRLGPWWSSWDGDPGYPMGVTGRFAGLGLDAIWPDYDHFAEATQWHQYAAMKFEIEAMRRQPSIAGYVITELSDIYWESNGLLDFERGTKVYHQRFRTINAPDVVVPKLDQYTCWDDDKPGASLFVSHYGEGEWTAARIEATLGESRVEAAVPPIRRGEVHNLGVFQWELPRLKAPASVSLNLRVYDDGGDLATNDIPLWVMPAASRQAAFQGEIEVLSRGHRSQKQTDASPLPAAFSALGYRGSGQFTGAAQLLIADHVTPDSLAWVRAGGRLLFLSAGASPFFWTQGRGGAYSGNWMTSFSWLRPGVHRRLPVSNPLTLSFIDMMPGQVILGLPVYERDYQPDFLAGQVTGWLGHPALHTVQFRCGEGRVVMTTYPLKEKLAYHPLAVAMLHDLVDHLASDACQPVLTAV